MRRLFPVLVVIPILLIMHLPRALSAPPEAPALCVAQTIQAEGGQRSSGLAIVPNQSASGGAYLEKPANSPVALDTVTLRVVVDVAGWYEVRARVHGVTSKVTSWRVRHNGNDFVRWMVIPGDSWLNDYPVKKTDGAVVHYNLSKGPHTFTFETESPTAKLDVISLRCIHMPNVTATSTPTETATPTATGTATPTASPTATATATGTATVTGTATGTATSTPTGTLSPTPTSSVTATPTSTRSPTPTGTLSATPTGTLSATPSPTATATLRATTTPTRTPSGSPARVPRLWIPLIWK